MRLSELLHELECIIAKDSKLVDSSVGVRNYTVRNYEDEDTVTDVLVDHERGYIILK
jgi:hypothetical protein